MSNETNNETSPQPRSDLYAMLLHTVEPRLLMLPGESGWSLPHIQRHEQIWPNAIARIAPALRDDLGIDAPVLRCAYARHDEDRQQIEAIYTLESQNPAWVPPPGAHWIGRAELSGLALAIPEQRATIEACLDEDARGVVPPLRPPWARRGWFKQAEAWIQTQLEQLGTSPIAPIEQVKTWGISCVLRARTSGGDLYFKAALRPSSDQPIPLLFAREPELTRALAAFEPDHIPMPLAIDHERGWMLLADFGTILRGNAEIAGWEQALALFGRIQVRLAGHVPALLAAGCLDRRLEVLAAQIDPLLNDSQALASLKEQEVEQLRRLAPQLNAMCAELASYGVPSSLAHGDLHAGNIALQEGRLIFFDWTDGCVAHPFLDLVLTTVLEDADAPPNTSDAPAHLRDIYLAQWTAYEPIERLIEAYTLAMPLGALHQAISYRHIVANLEASSKWELEEGVSFWLRHLLKLMPRAPSTSSEHPE